MKTKPIVFTALLITMYFVLNTFAIIFRMPQGGSATVCSTLFLVLPGFIYGRKYGFLSCLVASLLSFIISPYFLSPMQFLLDYTFAMCSWSIGAFIFSNKSQLALEKYYIVGLLFSTFFSILSGYIFFRQYTPEGWNPLFYTVAYNSSYRFTEALLVIILLRIKSFRNVLLKITTLESN